MTPMIPLAFGADLDTTVTWPYPLTGATVEVMRPSAPLEGHLTVTITDAAAGKFDLKMSWHSGLESLRVPLRFSLRVTPASGPRLASALIGIRIQ
jgi:hypothetical protein